jgi:hypothetical protein
MQQAQEEAFDLFIIECNKTKIVYRARENLESFFLFLLHSSLSAFHCSINSIVQSPLFFFLSHNA